MQTLFLRISLFLINVDTTLIFKSDWSSCLFLLFPEIFFFVTTFFPLTFLHFFFSASLGFFSSNIFLMGFANQEISFAYFFDAEMLDSIVASITDLSLHLVNSRFFWTSVHWTLLIFLSPLAGVTLSFSTFSSLLTLFLVSSTVFHRSILEFLTWGWLK